MWIGCALALVGTCSQVWWHMEPGLGTVHGWTCFVEVLLQHCVWSCEILFLERDLITKMGDVTSMSQDSRVGLVALASCSY